MEPLGPGEPAQVGRYRLLAAVGEGGMGRVLLGVAPDGRLAAVKQVHRGFASDPGFRERFRREVEVSRLVSGAYTAAVMDADAHAPTPWLASVFVAGPSLQEAVDTTGPLPPVAVRHLAAGLASALIGIHRAGLVHRDLKPGNVLLADDGPRVIDFGIARAAEGGTDLTHTGVILGSPAFMSPEQAEGRPLTPASDVFSLGALLVLAATGHSAFAGASAPQSLYNVVHTHPDLRFLPPELRALAEPCLAKDPARRPTPAQLLELLGPLPPVQRPWPPAVHALIARHQADVTAVVTKPPKPRRRGRRAAARRRRGRRCRGRHDHRRHGAERRRRRDRRPGEQQRPAAGHDEHVRAEPGPARPGQAARGRPVQAAPVGARDREARPEDRRALLRVRLRDPAGPVAGADRRRPGDRLGHALRGARRPPARHRRQGGRLHRLGARRRPAGHHDRGRGQQRREAVRQAVRLGEGRAHRRR